MKANELMVGDIILYEYDKKRFPARVEEIYLDSALVEEVNGEFEPIEIEENELFPIPLTPEILEKNGFVKNEKAKSKKSHTIIDSDVYISWWRNRANIVVLRRHIGLSSNHVNVDAKHVHQLQHALRLCGIEKAIEI